MPVHCTYTVQHIYYTYVFATAYCKVDEENNYCAFDRTRCLRDEVMAMMIENYPAIVRTSLKNRNFVSEDSGHEMKTIE